MQIQKLLIRHRNLPIRERGHGPEFAEFVPSKVDFLQFVPRNLDKMVFSESFPLHRF